jgi:hypothetical protein
MDVKVWPIERVEPYPGNPGDHEKAVDAVSTGSAG